MIQKIESYTSSTYTNSKPVFSDNRIEEEIMKYVRYASSDKDAIHNLRFELKEYKKSLKFWELIKLLLNL
jgi:hypothetical protein